MTAKYTVIARPNPINPTEPEKYYPSLQSTGRLTIRQLIQKISEISTVSPADTMAVLECLLSIIPQQMGQGNIVELGEFGTFWIRVKSKGSDTPDKVSARNITNVQPRFRPGKTFRQALDRIEFQKVQS